MVLTIAIPLRAAFDLEDFITMRHLDNMAKVMLAAGMLVAYGYFIEAFYRLVLRQPRSKRYVTLVGMFGPYAPCTSGRCSPAMSLAPQASLVAARPPTCAGLL